MLDFLVGNNEIKETVASFVKSGRFPHAIIIEGEKGSGRRTLARILAAAALCPEPDAPCGVCRTCRLIAEDKHCDVLTYSPDGATFKIDMVREIRRNAGVMPIEAQRKVNVLTDCEKMNEPAQNALLKLLEEPPAFMVFILIVNSAAALLSTVRSRCVLLTVENPDFQEAEQYLTLKTGNLDVKEALLSARGNIGRALDILNGKGAGEAAERFLAAVSQGDRLSALHEIYLLEKDRPGFASFLSELSRLLKENIKNGGRLSPAAAMRALDRINLASDTLRAHVGQPLYLPLFGAALCAQIFTEG